MSNTAIQIENLSKRYRLGVINNKALFKDIQTWIALKRGRDDPHSEIGQDKYNNTEDYFWALKDISLEIKQGDRVGIIGKNGAGKSTLLKILSRITAPTEGIVKIKGKVASLLEVGTGFHGELTGMENIYLNGAILGMKKRRIDKKMDEIIAFSGIEHHIDTPVKRYSSGMYVRLAFAVAAHLDSDILIADEVLAVGDAEFQKKAIGKMEDLSRGEGRTVLFVSHNMGAVKNLCNCGLVLEKGNIKYIGEINDCISSYTIQVEENIDKNLLKYINSEKEYEIDLTKPFQVKKIEILDDNYTKRNIYEAHEDIILRIHCISREPIPRLYGYFSLQREDSKYMIICATDEFSGNIFDYMPRGEYTIDLTIPKSILATGWYYPCLGFSTASAGIVKQRVHSPVDGLKFEVADSISGRGNSRGAYTSIVLNWKIIDKK